MSKQLTKSNEFSTVLRRVSFVFLCRTTGAFLTFASQVILARLMGAEGLGAYVYAFSICLLLTSASGLGLTAAGVRFLGAGVAQGRGDLVLGFVRRTYQIYVCVGLAIAGIGVLLVTTVEGFVASERQSALLVAFLLVPFFGQLVARTGLALGLSWPAPAFLPNTVLRPLLFLLLIAGAWSLSIPLTANGAMWLQLSAILLVLPLLIMVMRRRLSEQFSQSVPSYETASWMRTALPLLVITLFINYFVELNLIVAGSYLETGDLAVFSASFRTAALILFGLYAVDSITVPQISRSFAASDDTGFRSTIIRASRLRFLGSLAAGIALYFLGKPILLLFGERFVVGYEALLILIASHVVNAALGPTAHLLSITGFQNKCLRVFVFSLIAMLVLHPLFIRQFGINGAAMTVFCVVMLQSIWLYLLVVRHLGVHAWALARHPVNTEISDHQS